ncbi:putative kinase mug58 [Fusarium oxysporum f. sp. cubense]|uniref:Putative kinase mug58 n=1 Tax=Fusarium oxysporum f. sp. cubense TaxID=61366 RepID=A0A559LEU7_FUSOC|nr:putative kinase mug58 [Fusarium oxysporum f. sp. cubense]
MIDPKAIDTVLDIFVPAIQVHRKNSSRPFVLGLSGLQGSGKSTWAAALSQALTNQHNLKTRMVSLDDLYHDHPELVALREANPDNGLLQTRGQPGTHDEVLAKNFFDQVLGRVESDEKVVRWPAFDKSLHSGQGGRVPVEKWEEVPLDDGLDVLIFEGWALGFKPLTDEEVKRKWEKAKASEAQQSQEWALTNTLASHDLSHLLLINKNLRRYCETFAGPQHFDGFLHLSTDKLVQVYEWRLGQEKALRQHKPGMTDEQVIMFVKGYMPTYELFLERLQNENFFTGQGPSEKKHIQVVLNKNREVVQVKEV